MKRLLFLILIAIPFVYVIRTHIIEGIVVASGSMEPTIATGTHLFVNKAAYMFSSPKRGDIVMLTSPVNPEKGLIKRIIAVGGDTIEIKKKIVFLNGDFLKEPYVQYTRVDELLKGDNLDPMKVPKDHFFVMGDNRDESGDSRDWKEPNSKEHIYFVSKFDIKGKVINIY